MRSHVAGLLVILSACGEAPRMLHEMDSYAGEVELSKIGPRSGTGETPIAGVLMFDRASGHLQFQLREPEVVSLVRDSSGELRAFAGERWRAATDAEASTFDLISAVVRHRPEDRQEPMSWEGGYTVAVEGRRVGIRLLDEPRSHRMP